ncbi:TetR/AcrR family transcriptional regulator [Chondromyces apiculatus]|uniref:Transcriptional regulator, TetR family n=1 Tax=Chondromyces apiculatus DSM 436 TaxID=1192034 RepID=A0A017T0F4_9BACT|nr:TetR/AcrR family transcriptional regulator [Chondromyces apiculatus]EYF02477.1 Transcriptional regulator, TetR family [Chondromyces apiculatus DSM 436]
MSESERPRVGRKRSEASRTAILTAALKLATERGYAAVTIDAIAGEARVGKHTIYRWWRSKAEVLLQALSEATDEQVPLPDTGDLEEDLRQLLTRIFSLSNHEQPPAHLLRALMAEAQLDPDFLVLFHSFTEGRRMLVRERFAAARASGQIADGVDVEVLLDMIFGAIWHRRLLQHGPLDARFADAILAIAMAALRRPQLGIVQNPS